MFSKAFTVVARLYSNILKAIANYKNKPTTEFHRFLDLPAEIRNDIYAKVIGEDPAYPKSTLRGKLASRSALPRVNHQLRGEFLAILNQTANVKAFVLNYDFSHIVTFFNRLSDSGLKNLKPSNSPRHRSMVVELAFTGDPMYIDLSSCGLLRRWLNRIGHPAKKGADVNVSYVLAPGMAWSSWLWPRSVEHLKREKETFSSEKKKVELGKIIAALEHRG